MEFRRISGLPPYVFAHINGLKAAARAEAWSKRLYAFGGLIGVYAFWAAFSWVIFTYGMLIYRQMGDQAQKKFTQSWGISFGMDSATQWQDVAKETQQMTKDVEELRRDMKKAREKARAARRARARQNRLRATPTANSPSSARATDGKASVVLCRSCGCGGTGNGYSKAA